MESIVRGKTFAEYQILLQDGYHSKHGVTDLSPLKPYATQVWNAIVLVEHNDSLISEVRDRKQLLLAELVRLHKFIDLLLSCHNEKLKKWQALGEDYRCKIILQLQPILLEKFDDMHTCFQQVHNEHELLNDYWPYVAQYLDKLPSRDSLQTDEFGIIPTTEIMQCSRTVKRVISATRALIKNEGKSYEKYFPGEVTRAIFNTGIPKEKEFFEITYLLLDWLGLIPVKTRRDHEYSKNPDCKSDYIRAFVNIDSKHPAK